MGIVLSNKYGGNPSMNLCYYCQKEVSDILLMGRMRDDAEAPRQMTYHMDPCNKCREFMQQGVILIEVTSEEEMVKVEQEQREWQNQYGYLPDRKKPFPGYFIPNPTRAGGWWVVKDDLIRRTIGREMADYIIKHRWCFLPTEAAKALGLRDEEGVITTCSNDSGENSQEPSSEPGESSSSTD